MIAPEGLLRAPVELLPAGVSLAGAAWVALDPGLFHLWPWPARLATVAALGLIGIIRLCQAWRIVRYRLWLGRDRVHTLPVRDIPAHADRLYLGRGFRWLPVHTQRLAEVRMRPGRACPVRMTGWLAGRARRPSGDGPPPGGDPHIHGVEPDERPVWMGAAERVGHTLVLGTTRVGKTRLAELLVAQDIRRGDTVVFFDPKGDVDLLRRMHAEAVRAGRDRHFHLLHLGFPEISSRYNPIGSYSRVTEVAGRVTAQLPGAGQSAAFRNFAWRYANVIARALDALGIPPTFERLRRAAENIDPLLVKYYAFWLRQNGPEGWKEDFLAYERRVNNRRDTYVTVPREMKGRDPRAAALVMYVRDRLKMRGDSVIGAMEQVLRYDRAYFDKLVASLIPFLEKVTAGPLSSLVSPLAGDGDPRPIFDWAGIVDQGGIVYVGLDTLADHEVGSAIGHAMFSDLKSVAASLYRARFAGGGGGPAPAGARAVCVHADEMSEIAGEEVTGMFNKAGGAGFHMTVYAQTKQDLMVRLGGAAAAEQQIGNLNSLVVFRVKNRETAALLTDQLARTETVAGRVSSTATDDGGAFSSHVGDSPHVTAQPLLAAGDLMALPRGEAFALLDGGRLHKVRVPLLDDDGGAQLPSLADIAAQRRPPARGGEE